MLSTIAFEASFGKYARKVRPMVTQNQEVP